MVPFHGSGTVRCFRKDVECAPGRAEHVDVVLAFVGGMRAMALTVSLHIHLSGGLNWRHSSHLALPRNNCPCGLKGPMYLLAQWPRVLCGSINSVAPTSCRSCNPAVNRREDLGPSRLAASHKTSSSQCRQCIPCSRLSGSGGWGKVGCELVGWGKTGDRGWTAGSKAS